MESKYITIEKISEKIYLIQNKKSQALIGKIYYYRLWKRYVFETVEFVIWDSGCLKTIIDFLDELNDPKPKEEYHDPLEQNLYDYE